MKSLCALLLICFGVFAQDDAPAGAARRTGRSAATAARAGALDDRDELRHRRGVAVSGVAGRRQDPRSRRQRHRCRDRGQRGAGPHAAVRQRHGRRPLRHRLRGQDRQGLRAELQRLDAEGAHHRLPEEQGHRQDRPARRPHHHRARAASPDGTRCAARFGTKPFAELLASAIFYAENGFPLPEIGARSWITQALLETAGLQGDLHAGRRAAAARRRLQESRARRIAAPGRRQGPRRLLQGQASPRTW